MPTFTTVLSPIRSASARYFFEYSLVFAAYYVTATGGLYLLIHFHTTPAIIWLPAGISAIAAIFGGYRMWMPVFLAQFLASLTLGRGIELGVIFAIAYAVQTISFSFGLRRARFEPLFDRTRNVLIFIAAAFILTMVAPFISTLLQLLLNIAIDPLASWTRIWAGGIFSVLVVVPLVATWYPWPQVHYSRFTRYEIASALILLIAVVVFIFWTPYARMFGVSVIFFIPAVLIWFALSLHPRWLALGIFVFAVLALVGTFVTSSIGGALNQQLFTDEIYIGMVAAIFYVFVAVVEERRRAFADLEIAYRTTFESDQAKNEFIAILAHELRNPLSPIVSSLELLSLEPLSEENKQTIREAQEHALMIRRLLDDLLDTARLAQKKFTLKKESVRVADIIDSSVAQVSEFAASKNIALAVSSKCGSLMIDADPVRLKQIVINLLNNACKYTMPGGSVELRCSERANMLQIRVRDTGIGIAPEMLGRIFEPFKQIGEVSRYSAGLGIGLHLTKRLVEMHGGTLSAQSGGLGKGSTFTVRIPIEKTIRTEPMASEWRPGEMLKILVVDDNEAAARGLQKLLTRHGHDVRCILRGAPVFAAVASFDPNVILLDIGLPDMSGYEVARKLREAGYQKRIIALTGYGQETDREEARAAGFNGHLTKPVGITDVLAALSQADENHP